MGDLALPHILPRVHNPRRETRKYANFLLALRARRAGAARVAHHPFDLTVDCATLCQLHCPYCAVGNGTIRRGRALMETALHERLAANVAPDLFLAWYFSAGEPLLHPRLHEHLARTAGEEAFTVVSTNLSVPLSPARQEALLRSGLGMLSASVDGASAATYGQYRRGGDFALVMDNLAGLARRKREMGLQFPLLEWRFLLFAHNQHEVDTARSLAADMGLDLLEFFPGYALPPGDPGEQGVHPMTAPMPGRAISGPAYEAGLARRETLVQRLTAEGAAPAPAPVDTAEGAQAGDAASHRRCDWLYYSGMIYPDGAFGPCCVATDADDDFTRLDAHPDFGTAWNAPAFLRSRGAFAAHGGTTAANGNPSGTGGRASTVCDRCPLPVAQELQFVQKVRAILRNAPDWVVRILSAAPDAFFLPADSRRLPVELAALRRPEALSLTNAHDVDPDALARLRMLAATHPDPELARCADILERGHA
ncbi:radical SAM protein [Nitratidesulfovibrio sp. HK-II]|uniref:radical SAM protein n=1 Tax=Nitratidesulfovibrio sp. HK-II TaxID=2009266 RepID=UPI000E2FB089|nr:radical SAM protein [Nitratidesulfovibrio sp. HK-II]GBO97696.1 pyrroloquinoline quinone biosynthesis protein PqqE [Nitratidesulfovibrio sp. HK-II]